MKLVSITAAKNKTISIISIGYTAHTPKEMDCIVKIENILTEKLKQSI